MGDRKYCSGCREDFYNGQGAKECWSLKSAKVVRRFRLGWWTTPDTPGAFTEVETHSCHSSPGVYAHYQTLPDFAVEPKRLEKKTARTADQTSSWEDAF